jgi:Aminoglycoside N3''-acetyltransferase
MNISKDQFQSIVSDGLEPGDDVMIHASLSAIGHYAGGIDEMIDLICDAVTHTGTVIMTTATRSFAKTKRFSPDQPSENGLMTEIFRQREGVKRSCVPMASVAAWGARQDDYTQVYDSNLDETSPFTALLRHNGKMMLLGIGYEKCTLFHLSEERFQLPHNFYKSFEGELIQEGEEPAPISQRYYVRKDMSVKKDPAVAGHMLEARGLVNRYPLGKGEVKIFTARDFDHCCMEALEKNPNAFIV